MLGGDAVRAISAIVLFLLVGKSLLEYLPSRQHHGAGVPETNPPNLPFDGQYEFYQIDSRYALLHDPTWLLDQDIIFWPPWVLTALTNYLYCKKHGYTLTLWAIPDSRLTHFTNRGWGNAFTAHYIKTRLDQGAWPQRDWLVYLDSDSFVRRSETRVEDFLTSHPMYTPLEVQKGDVNLHLKDDGNTVKALHVQRMVVNATEEVFLLAAPEVPIPLVLPAIAHDSWLNSGVLFLNMRHRLSHHLLTRWSRSVTDLCGDEWRFYRLADQYCLNVLFFRGDRSQGYMNHVAFLEDPMAFNTPVGDFIRHPWQYHHFHPGTQADHSFVLFGFELLSQGYRSKDKFHALLREMIDSGALRQLPIVMGDNSPAYVVNGIDWDIQTEHMSSKAGELMRGTWQTSHSRAAVSDIRANSVPAASSSECLVVADRDFACGIVTWRVNQSMVGSCSCYEDQNTNVTTLRFATTWTRTKA